MTSNINEKKKDEYAENFKSVLMYMIEESKIQGLSFVLTVIDKLTDKDYFIRKCGGFLWDNRELIAKEDWGAFTTKDYTKQIKTYSTYLHIPESLLEAAITAIIKKLSVYIVRDANFIKKHATKLLNLHIKWQMADL